MLAKAIRAILILIGSIGFMWLVVIRIVAKLKGGEPCPYVLAWITDNPFRRWYMRDVLSWIGIRTGERVLELGPGPGAFTIPAA